MSNNYTLGRGEVHFGQFTPGGQVPRGERYFGNTPELGFNAEQESLDHYSSDRGVRIKDESVLLQLDYAGSFITDNISPENLAAFFLGEEATASTSSASGVAFALPAIEQGASYQLGTSDTKPSGTRQITTFAITTPADCVVDVDYTIDLELARITPIVGSTKLTEGLTGVVGTFNQSAYSVDKVVSKATTVEGALRYIAKNPAGKQIDYFMPWVKITPNGDFQLKGDEWQQLPFTLEILKKGTLESIYMDGRPYTP